MQPTAYRAATAATEPSPDDVPASVVVMCSRCWYDSAIDDDFVTGRVDVKYTSRVI
jgi:hypothetical protein